MTDTIVPTPYRVRTEQYRQFRRDGFLVVRGLLSSEEVLELKHHTEELMAGRLPEQQATANVQAERRTVDAQEISELETPPEHLSPEEKANYFTRIHMLHRKLALHERYLLHPGILDVLEALTGPDLMALQSMLFIKGPGKAGQGWHQDSYYLPTFPDSLCAAWIAIDDVDEYNGAMWFAKGSQHEPVYPPKADYGYGNRGFEDTQAVGGVSNPDDAQNDLARIAEPYDQILIGARAGDVVFFGGHVLHRSKRNITTDRFRRAFVCHYANARSYTPWSGEGHDSSKFDANTGMGNGAHILARGDTHLPFALPKFGTPCAALDSLEVRRARQARHLGAMGDMDSGMIEIAAMPIDLEDDH